jgi:dihydropteroate synthase
MIWKTKNRIIDCSGGPVLVGILNATPDSFSDGGSWTDPERAVGQVAALVAAGAQVIDIGGESTRPGARPVGEAVELARVLPVVERLAGRTAAALSVDTSKPGVARAALAAGAEIVNDVTGLAAPAMRELVAETGAGAVVMHMLGDPNTMQAAPHYEDVVSDVREFFRHRLAQCVASGIDPMQLAFDPGIGFGKTLAHNLALVRATDRARIPDRPLVVGVSRKSFVGSLSGVEEPWERDWPTAVINAWLRHRGVEIFRVHDVRKNRLALRVADAILETP